MSTLNSIFQNQKPQKVEVTNDIKTSIQSSEDNPLHITFPSDFSYGSVGSRALRTYASNTASWVLVRPSSGLLNVCVGSCVASNQGASVVVPLNIVYYNLPQARVDELVSELENKLPLLFPTGSTIRFVYSTLDNSQNSHFYVVSVQ